LTLQCVSEFYWAATRKRIVLPDQAVALANEWLDMYSIALPSVSAAKAALAAAADGRTSYWDAQLIATAAEAGCAAILTEDLSHGSTLFGVRIVNPFDGDVLSPEADRLLTAA
jgi:predicted nucleic acid-binding protein